MNSILHIVNKSPFTHGVLASCLDKLQANDAIILIEDGVYAAMTSHSSAVSLEQLNKCYALEKDIVARGLPLGALLPNIQLIDYDRFVNLCVEYPLNHSWY